LLDPCQVRRRHPWRAHSSKTAQPLRRRVASAKTLPARLVARSAGAAIHPWHARCTDPSSKDEGDNPTAKEPAMKCKEAMTIGLRVLPLSATVQDAALTMRENSLGFLPVCDETGRLAGVITDRDIAMRVAPFDRIPSSVLAEEAMTPRPLVCGPEEPIEAAESRMIHGGVSRMVVVDQEGFPQGIISLTDILLKDRAGRALDTARQVLSREAAGPHLPVEDIVLTPAPYPSAVPAPNPDYYQGARRYEGTLAGGTETRGMKEFPR
jgi:CBS domain-containing protein